MAITTAGTSAPRIGKTAPGSKRATGMLAQGGGMSAKASGYSKANPFKIPKKTRGKR